MIVKGKTQLLDITAGALISLAIAGAVIITTYLWASSPVVIRHWPSGRCLSVESMDNFYSCDNLPERFELQWRM